MRLFRLIVSLFLLLIGAFSLIACSGGDGTSGYTISTSAGANGSISPASIYVIQNDTASFTVTPDAGYRIDTVSGCGGSLSGNIYITDVITADCTVSASFVERTLGAVSALFPDNAPNWNDYVTGRDWSAATDTACAAAIDNTCTHGGEHRVVEATGRADCTGISATDELGAFNWLCDDSSGAVRLISTGLAAGKSLSDLVDFTTPGFRANAVTVFENGSVWGSTPASTWWTNTVVINNSGGSLADESTIYLVTVDPAQKWKLDADKIALIIQPGLTITAPGNNDMVIEASGLDYLWIEGDINASGEGIGVSLSTVRFSMLRNLAANNSPLGVFLNDSNNNRLTDVTASNCLIFGISIENRSNYNWLSGLRASNNSTGITLSDESNNNTISDLVATNNSIGVSLTATSNNNTLSNVTVSNNSTGVLFDTASNNTISGVTASNNSTFGISLDTASNNNTLMALAASNNDRGINLDNSSNSNQLTDLAAGNNNVGVIISNSDNNIFSGLLEVGSNSFDCLVFGGTNPGLSQPDCAASGASDHILVDGIDLAGSLVGKVVNDDVLNTSDTDGMAGYPVDPAAFDWAGFDNAYRGWGIDGSDFPNVDHQGQWTVGAGRIWDWSVSSGDSGNSGFAALLAVFTVPTGNDTLTHSWNGIPVSNDDTGCDLMQAGSLWNSANSACETTFLRNAMEIPADGLGNDNSLCESGETCLYTPNIGSYQGHGDLISAGTFTAGTLTGIRLLRYKSNGR